MTRHKWDSAGGDKVRCRNCGYETTQARAKRGVGKCTNTQKEEKPMVKKHDCLQYLVSDTPTKVHCDICKAKFVATVKGWQRVKRK